MISGPDNREEPLDIPQWIFVEPDLKVRREAIQVAVAKAYVLKDRKAHLHPRSVLPFWDCRGPHGNLPTSCQMRLARTPKCAIARLRQGELGIEEALHPWTGSFFLGLRLSGALAEKESGRFRLNTKLFPELARDIEEWHIVGGLGADDGYGRKRLVACPAASHLPPDNPESGHVLAGLFAGGHLQTVAGQSWIELPENENIVALLDRWTILHQSGVSQGARHKIMVSPFYAALFVSLMPMHSANRILNLRRPAMCPILPVMYWEWFFGFEKGMRMMPFAGALPFACSRRTFFRRGWKRGLVSRICG